MKQSILFLIVLFLSALACGDHYFVYPISSTSKSFEVNGLKKVDLSVAKNENPLVTIESRGLSVEINLNKLHYFSDIDLHSGVIATDKNKLLYALFKCVSGEEQITVTLLFANQGKALAVSGIEGECEIS
jgi:hypothetical protein